MPRLRRRSGWPLPDNSSSCGELTVPALTTTSRPTAASRKDVVSAGTINSPQLLELSGIGQPGRLRSLGIEVRHALPGVGENLRDHYAPRTRWAIGTKGITYNDRGRGL